MADVCASPLGTPRLGEQWELGTTVSLSEDGTVLATGAIRSSVGATYSGSTSIFRNNGTAWTWLGTATQVCSSQGWYPQPPPPRSGRSM